MSTLIWRTQASFNGGAFDTIELYPDQLHHIRKVLSEMEKINQRIAVICIKARGGK